MLHLRTRAILVLALAACAFPAATARGDDKPGAKPDVTMADRRATLALWNSLAPEEVKRSLDKVQPDHVRRLDVFNPNGVGGGRELAIRYGTAESDGHGRGSYKIVLGGTSVDLAATGWVVSKVNPRVPAEVWLRDVDRSERERYSEYGLRGRFGPVELMVSERRAKGEAPAAAVAALAPRFSRLHAAAKDAGLLCSLRATFEPGEGKVGVDLVAKMPLLTLPAEGRRLAIRLELLDGGGAPIEALWTTIELTATLKDRAKIASPATFDPSLPRYELRGGGAATTVTVVLPPLDADVLQAIDESRYQVKHEPTLGLRLRVRQKGAVGKDVESLDGLPDAQLDVGFEVLPWTAYVAALFVAPPAARDDHAYAVAGPDSSVAASWRELRRGVLAPKPDEAIATLAKVYSGFRLEPSEKNASSFFVGHYGVEAERPLVLAAGDDARVFTAFCASAALRRHELGDLVAARFRVLDESLSVVRVSADPEVLRAAVGAASPETPIASMATPAVPAAGTLAPKATWHAAERGVYEVRLRARMSGSLSDEDATTTQTLEAAVRVAVGDRQNSLTWRDVR